MTTCGVITRIRGDADVYWSRDSVHTETYTDSHEQLPQVKVVSGNTVEWYLLVMLMVVCVSDSSRVYAI